MMELNAYWWSPLREVKSAIVELQHNRVAWWHLLKFSGGNVTNFGDALNRVVIEALFGEPPKWSSLSKCDLVCIGSVLNSYVSRGSAALVLGSGVRNPKLFDSAEGPLIPADKCVSVRGVLSRDALRLPQDTPLGEPGLLISRIIAKSTPQDEYPRVGLLPHFSEFGDRASRAQMREARLKGYEILYPNASPRELAREISSLDLLVTSSLHGLVFANAYGVPAQLVSFASRNTENPFKFNDYLSVFDLQAQFRPLGEIMSTPLKVVLRSLEPQNDVIGSRLEDVQNEILKASESVLRLLPNVASKIA